MIGYRWFIRAGAYWLYEPHEASFDTYEQACLDAEQFGYDPDYYGVDLVDDDDEYVKVLEHVKVVKKTWFEPEC